MASSKTRAGYEAFVVSQEGSSAYWTKVGAGWKHEDGRGINLSLTPGLAVTGKIVLRDERGDNRLRRQERPVSKGWIETACSIRTALIASAHRNRFGEMRECTIRSHFLKLPLENTASSTLKAPTGFRPAEQIGLVLMHNPLQLQRHGASQSLAIVILCGEPPGSQAVIHKRIARRSLCKSLTVH